MIFPNLRITCIVHHNTYNTYDPLKYHHSYFKEIPTFLQILQIFQSPPGTQVGIGILWLGLFVHSHDG